LLRLRKSPKKTFYRSFCVAEVILYDVCFNNRRVNKNAQHEKLFCRVAKSLSDTSLVGRLDTMNVAFGGRGAILDIWSLGKCFLLKDTIHYIYIYNYCAADVSRKPNYTVRSGGNDDCKTTSAHIKSPGPRFTVVRPRTTRIQLVLPVSVYIIT